MKEKDQLYVDGAGLTNNQQNKKDDTLMKYFPKTAHWGHLVPIAEGVENTTNPYFKNPRTPYVAENEAYWFLKPDQNLLHFPQQMGCEDF